MNLGIGGLKKNILDKYCLSGLTSLSPKIYLLLQIEFHVVSLVVLKSLGGIFKSHKSLFNFGKLLAGLGVGIHIGMESFCLLIELRVK